LVLALADIKGSLEHGISLGVLFNGGNPDPLNEISSLFWMVFRINPKQDREEVFRPRQLPQRHGNIVAAMEAKIESEKRFFRAHDAREILTILARFENRKIRVLDPHHAILRPHDDLCINQPDRE
jgi:hypothetical protein